MNWILQKTGIINHHSDTDLGSQPVRVIHYMLTYMFVNTHENFFDDLKKQVAEGKLSKEFQFVFADEPILMHNRQNTPKVHNATKKIELHETFLSYLWCCTNAVFTLYVETVDNPRMNKLNGRITHPISDENIQKAQEIFNYAKSLIVDFTAWDKDNLPNPEVYLAEKRDYVEQTNVYYTEAVKFILCHEFTHIKYHLEQLDKATTDSHFLQFEIEADNNAIDMMKKGISKIETLLTVAHRLAIENGIIFGILSMFFFSASTVAKKHPHTEDRLTNALERLDLIDNPFAWGIACTGLQLWEQQFNLNFEWSKEPITFKEQYYLIIKQIKERKV
jgi:hypothetical protein